MIWQRVDPRARPGHRGTAVDGKAWRPPWGEGTTSWPADLVQSPLAQAMERLQNLLPHCTAQTEERTDGSIETGKDSPRALGVIYRGKRPSGARTGLVHLLNILTLDLAHAWSHIKGPVPWARGISGEATATRPE